MTLRFDVWPRKIIGHLFYTTSSFVYHFKSIGEFKLKLHSGNAQFGSKSIIFCPCDLIIWWMTLENNRAPLLYYIKLCSSFQIHRWTETEVTLRKRSIWVKIGDFFVLCDLEIWWMILKNNRAPLLYFFKLCASFHSHQWIQTGVAVRNAQFWSKSTVFLAVWLEIKWMTFKNNRAPLLCYFKLCAAFRSHWWVQTGVTVRKHPIWVKFDNF